jgi:hypothetical protein
VELPVKAESAGALKAKGGAAAVGASPTEAK